MNLEDLPFLKGDSMTSIFTWASFCAARKNRPVRPRQTSLDEITLSGNQLLISSRGSPWEDTKSTDMTETRRVSQFPPTLLDQGPKSILKASGDTPPKSNNTVSFSTGGPLSSSRKPSGVTKIKGPKLTKDVKRRDENPWETYAFVDEIIRKHDTVTKARKILSGQMFCFRTFPLDEKFEVIEQQFKLLDHHNVLPAQDFFRQKDKGLIRSPVMDVSFDRIVTCRQYPSSGTLASIMGQVRQARSM